MPGNKIQLREKEEASISPSEIPCDVIGFLVLITWRMAAGRGVSFRNRVRWISAAASNLWIQCDEA